MEKKHRRVKIGNERSHSKRFIKEWLYGPYQDLISEQICLVDPAWLSQAISQKIIGGNLYLESRLQKLTEINQAFSITPEAKKALAERKAKYEIERAFEKKEKERVKGIMAARDLKYSSLNEEAKSAHTQEILKLIGWWFKPFDVQLESGKYRGLTPKEIFEKRTEDAMEDFSKAIVNHYYFPSERDIDWIKQDYPSFNFSDEASEIYEYEKNSLANEKASEEYIEYLAYEEHLKEMDRLGEPSERSSEDYNDNLDLDQQHPDFYQG